jgi:hypothetical protein
MDYYRNSKNEKIYKICGRKIKIKDTYNEFEENIKNFIRKKQTIEKYNLSYIKDD